MKTTLHLFITAFLLFINISHLQASSSYSCKSLQDQFTDKTIHSKNFIQKKHIDFFEKWYRQNLAFNEAEDCLTETAKTDTKTALILSRYLLYQAPHSKSLVFAKQILKKIASRTLSKKQKNTALYLSAITDWFASDFISYKKKLKSLKMHRFLRKSELLKNLILSKVYTPFKKEHRRRYRSVKRRFESAYGDYRGTYKRGHKHSGIDLRGKLNEAVYAIGPGMVYNIHLGFPHRTVVVLHFLPNGKHFFSCYKHVERIKVKLFQWVNEKTEVGRLFTKRENRKAGFTVNHLHFEIRKNFDDQGSASWTSMTMRKLNRHFSNPMTFFKRHLR